MINRDYAMPISWRARRKLSQSPTNGRRTYVARPKGNGSPRANKATALMVTKIVELAKASRRGENLIKQTLEAFAVKEPERRTGVRTK
jgi:hypothetical protein